MSHDTVVEASAVGKLIRREALQVEKHGVQHKRENEEATTKSNDTAGNKVEYVVDRLVVHSNEDGRWKHKVR